MARQPILTADQKVFGYELLFRDSDENCFSAVDAEAASRSALDNSILVDLDVLCDGRIAFINFTREILLKDYITLLPPKQVAPEILDSVVADDLVIAACKRLKAGGYTISLDDFTINDPRHALLEFADIVKVDLKLVPMEQAASLARLHATPTRRMLAKRVETREEFAAAARSGFALFQGYFFRKPEMMQVREMPANGINYLRLLQAVSRPEVDLNELENIIKGEASLCYRLLRYLNSPIFGFSKEIRSVRHALAMLGGTELCRWIRLAATLVASQDKPSDLVLSALVRARFCELIGAKTNSTGEGLFLVGLLSLMDCILNVPMGLVLDGLSLDPEAKAVLLHKPSQLSAIYELMLAQETADWDQVTSLCSKMGVDESFVAKCRWDAMQWARQMTSGV
jgi:EAL and modified HD-GYP domain-containing signal transduction protein